MVDYDPYSDAVMRDPFPVYAELRREAPVFYHEKYDTWFLSRFEDIRASTTNDVFSAEKGLNTPRYPKLKDIMQAKKKPLDEVDISLEASTLKVESLELPAARAEGRIVGEGAAAVDELVSLLRNEAKVI